MAGKIGSASSAVLASGGRYVRLLAASLAPPTAVLLGGRILGRETLAVATTMSASGEASVAASPELLAIAGVGVAVLALGGSLAAVRDARTTLWGFAGALLLLGLVPFAESDALVVVGALVVAGAGIAALPRAWSHLWFLAATVLSTVGVGTLAFVQVSGYVAVMVPVGYAVVFGVAVCAVGASDGRAGRSPATGPVAVAVRTTVAERSLAPLLAGVATRSGWRRVWVLVVVWSAATTIFHFGGLIGGFYLRYGWWDTASHTVSGVGVAAILYLLRPGAFDSTSRALLVLPGLVIVIGGVFEVYEFVFRSYFFQSWTVEHYLRDTMFDLVANTTGAVLFAVLAAGGVLRRLR